MLQLKCDRCGNTSDDVKAFSMQGVPESNVFRADAPAWLKIPDDWINFEGKHLCNYCALAVRNLVARAPARAMGA